MSLSGGYRAGNEKRERIHQAAWSAQQDTGKPIPITQLAATVEMPPSTVRYHLQWLERDGTVARLYGGRAVEVLIAPPSEPVL